ncbi:MAG: tetratricopeptide repeat protein [Candidatus Acidiferrum sp.]
MWRLLFAFFLLAVGAAHARFVANPQSRSACTLRIDVAFASGGRAGSGVRVQLLQGLMNASAIEVEMTNSSGSAEFHNLLSGDYRVEVSGDGIETTTSSIIHIEDGRVFLSQFVAVQRESNGESSAARVAGPMVTVTELEVPKKASEELAKGNTEMQRSNWKRAAEHFNKAVSLYPQYASAYYNLSVAYYRLGQQDQQRDALHKALQINDHFLPVLVSLSHLDLAARNLTEARALLDKAVSLDPTNIEALALRVRVDFLQGDDEQAVADGHKAHDMPHQGYATVHYTAAAALQRLNRIPEMLAELQMFLQEDPTNPSASYVRETIASLQNQAH